MRERNKKIRDAFLDGAFDDLNFTLLERPSPASQSSAGQMPHQPLLTGPSLDAESAGSSSGTPSSVSLKRKHDALGRGNSGRNSIKGFLKLANGGASQQTTPSKLSPHKSVLGSVHNSAKKASPPEFPSSAPLPAVNTARSSSTPEQDPPSSMVISDGGDISARAANDPSSPTTESCLPRHSAPAPESGRIQDGHASTTLTATPSASAPPAINANGQVKDQSVDAPTMTQSHSIRHVDRSSATAILKKSQNHFFPKSLPQSYDDFSAVEIFRRKLSLMPGPPITFCYDGKDLDLDLNFEFVDHYKLGEGVVAIDEEFKCGCDCEGGICDPHTCTCAFEGGTRVGTLNGEEDDVDFIPPYIQNDLGMTVLSPEFLQREHNHIYECSSRCSCNSKCWNRVTQEGRKVRLELFKTEHCGLGKYLWSDHDHADRLILTYLGLRSPDPIYQGQFIDLYKGEVITIDESDRRLHALGDTVSYQFSLDKLTSEDYYVVDGRRFASVTRYANHSCNPNILTKTISQCITDEKIIEIGFFALRDIPPLEELRFDYNPQIAREKITKIDPDAVKCRCGAENCRGQLWPNSK